MGIAVVIDLVVAHESKGMDKGDILGVLVHGALLAWVTYFLAVG